MSSDGPSIHDLVVHRFGNKGHLVLQDVLDRKRVGFERYGTMLQANNGRDPVKDMYQELLDALVYGQQVLVEHEGLRVFESITEDIFRICCCIREIIDVDQECSS